RNNAATPYAFVVTNDNGIVLSVLPGSTASLSISAPGVCRGFWWSYIVTLTVNGGDTLNTTPLADNCFELSSNFVRISKREVDGGMVRLAEGGTSRVVCVVEGNSTGVSFANNSTATGGNYRYLVTDVNNNILAITDGNNFNFQGINARNLRVWGVSFSGNLLARVGDNVATAALSNECYDLSDNFITITRQVVDGAVVSLESGATSAVACTGDGRSDIFAFRNTSTSVESFIYIITDSNGNVIGFINGHQFDFNNLNVPTARVYGLSYSGDLRVKVGDNINNATLASNCADLSNNFVTVTRTFVDGSTVSLENGSTSAQVCLGSTNGRLTFKNNSTSTERYAYLATDVNNNILIISNDNIINFSTLTGTAFRVWGLSYSGNLTATVGTNAAQAVLSSQCYELSENFVTITTDVVDGGAVSLANGTTTALSCVGDASAGNFTFTNNSNAAGDTYFYAITNSSNVVIRIENGSAFNLDNLATGTYRVWGVSITGTSNLEVGDTLTSTVISSECYDLSSNFVTITRSEVDGGTVQLTGGGTTAALCSNSDTTTLQFANTSTSDENYAYVITDNNNVIIAFATGNAYNFAGTTDASFRVWGLAYTGNITARIGDNAATTALTNGCYELSSNFISVTRQGVNGGTVRLQDGRTSAVACLGVAEIGELTFVNNSTATASYIYLVTDTVGNIRAVVTNNLYNFNNLPIGTYRVRGLSYTGNLQAAVGGAINEVLSDACYQLSSNFITVTQKDVDGGRVALTNGDTSVFVCGSTSTPGTLTFAFSNNSNAAYTYLVTDRNNRIIVILNGNSISFNGAAIGEYRVWGLSYTGTLQARVGSVIDTVRFSNECYELSSNFVTIRREATDGGNIAEAGGRTAYNFCPGNGKADVLNFLTTGNSSGSYIYVLTDNNNRIINRLNGTSINFDTLSEGSYRVWGLAFTGTLNLRAGDNITQAMLSNGCFSRSGNFISITNQIPNGGTVALEEDLTEIFTCPADNEPDFVRFFRQGVVGSNFVFLVTDTNNIVEAIVSRDSFDFERPTEGINRVWGLAYSGNLTVKVGDNAATAALSDDCYDLSANFIQIIRELPNGGIVSLENGDSTVFICANSNTPQVVQFDSTGTSRGEYIYVITDSNNVIRNGIAGDKFDFSFLSPPGEYRVWGLAYTGTLIATIGDTVTVVPISDDCYTLSENFVTVTISSPDGGAITANGGTGPIRVCSVDGTSTPIQLANNSPAATATYTYLITDNANQVLQIVNGNRFNFAGITADSVRIWGLSYSGDLLAKVGDDAATARLASNCFDLSSNFIVVSRASVSGAMVSSNGNTNVIYTCVGDGVADQLTFSNSGTSGSQYRYVITNENNIIRGVINGNQFNFETAGRGVSRVWGVSFTGNFTGAFGANITTANLATGCFDLSDNFLTISRDQVLGGEITGNNQTNLLFCPSPDAPGVVMSTTSELFTGYQYVLTNVNNDVLALPKGDTIRFDSLPVGNYRIWGLSYAGNLLVKPGDNILGADLASSCYEISASFVSVYRSTTIDGGRIFNLAGEEVLTVCQSDTISDIVVLDNDSDAKDANYRYILTDANNRIILRNIDNEVIDFNRAARGIYRIWGVSYTGNFIGLSNDNAASAILADSCYQLSSNFITINVETPNPGRVLTRDSLSTVTLEVGDANSDVVTFVTLGAAGGTVDYLVVDSAEVIQAIITTDSIDFESFTPGRYRVRSVAYTGNLTAMVGDTATRARLSDDCFALSTSSVLINLVEDMNLQDPSQGQRNQAIITVSPNPVVDKLRVDFQWSEAPNATNELIIFNLMGQPVYQARIPVTSGENQYTLNLNDLTDGFYILQLRNGAEVQSIRFLKQWQ
ncbi:MAG: T9SS type A sorting domain-containing protein, partial [Saprospiraceae bacterium]